MSAEPKKQLTNKKPAFKRDEKWAKAKTMCRLNQEDIVKAKKLGLTPEVLLKTIPAPDERWKSSLKVKVWIQDLYAKKFGEKE